MPIASRYSGKCKDCGKVYVQGDQIDMNGNESPNSKGETKPHWCPDGENCQGAMDLTGGTNPSDGNIQAATQAALNQAERITKAEALRKKYFAGNIEDMVLLRRVEDGEKAGLETIGFYLGVLEACNSMGITEPPVIGMIFNKTMERM